MEKENKPKRKILKYVLWILLVVIIIFVALTIRRMIIIKDLQNKVSEYTKSTNYYAKTVTHQDSTITTETYVKDNSYIAYLNVVNADGDTRTRITEYSDGVESDKYIESGGKKTALLNSEGLYHKLEISRIFDYLYTENFGQLLLLSMVSSIRSEEVNGKECYHIDRIWSPHLLWKDGNGTMHIDKETGLPVKFQDGILTKTDTGEKYDVITDFEYKFNVVTDEDIKEPNAAEYEIVEQD